MARTVADILVHAREDLRQPCGARSHDRCHGPRLAHAPDQAAAAPRQGGARVFAREASGNGLFHAGHHNLESCACQKPEYRPAEHCGRSRGRGRKGIPRGQREGRFPCGCPGKAAVSAPLPRQSRNQRLRLRGLRPHRPGPGRRGCGRDRYRRWPGHPGRHAGARLRALFPPGILPQPHFRRHGSWPCHSEEHGSSQQRRNQTNRPEGGLEARVVLPRRGRG